MPALIEALASPESACKEKAARILGCFGELAAEAVPALTLALHNKDQDIRLAVAKSLWNITKNAELSVPALASLLDESRIDTFDSSEARRRFLQTVIEALSRIGPLAQAAVPASRKRSRTKIDLSANRPSAP